MRTGTMLRLAIAPTIPHMRFAFRSLLLFRPLPVRNRHLLHAGEGQLPRRGVLGERGSRTECRAPPHAYRRDELGVRAYENVVLDDGAVLVRSVVVAHDRAGADVDVSAHLAVADVGQVIRLGTCAYATRLDLHEVADVHSLGEARAGAGTDARVGADAAVRADVGVLEVAEGLDARARTDRHALQHAIRADGHAVAELHLAFEHAVDVDRHVAAAGKDSAHVAARGIGERHPVLEERSGKLALVNALQIGELAAAVHAERFPRRVRLDCGHGYALLRCERDDIGEVILLLRVVVLQLREPGLEFLRRCHDDSGVDLAQGALPRVGVLFLDNSHHLFSISQDAPVSGGSVERRSQKSQSRPRRVDEMPQGFGANQRNISIEHEGRPALVQMRGGLHHRVAGPELRLLHDPDDAVLLDGLAHALAAVAIDDADDLGRELFRGVENVGEHRPARQAMQHLGRARMHALARTCGENDDIHKKAEAAGGANVSLSRQLGEPHQELIDRARTLASLPNGPYDERLAAPHVARGEDLRNRSDVAPFTVARRLGVAARVPRDAERIEHFRHRRNESHREKNEVCGQRGLRAAHFARLPVLPLEPDGLQRLHLAILADEFLGGDRPVAIDALLVRGGGAQSRRPIGPNRVQLGIRRHGKQFELRHRFRAVAVRGADAVRARVASADHDDMFVGRPEVLHALVSCDAPVLQRQELHREMHAVELAAGNRQVARLLGSAGEYDCVEVGLHLPGVAGVRGQIGDALPGAPLADEDTGTEHHAFSLHLIDPAVDQPLLHLEIGYPVAQKTTDPVVFFEQRDVVPGARELLGASEPRRTGAHHRDFLSGLVLGRLWPYPAFLERLVDDRVLDRLDADRVVIDAQHARVLTRSRTDAAGELGKIVGGMQRLDGALPILPVDEIVEIRNDVVDRASGHAKRRAAVHATRALDLRLRFGEAEDELPIVLFPLLGLLVRLLEPLELEKSRDFPHLRCRLAFRRGELAEGAPVFLGEDLHETRTVLRPFFEDLPGAAAVRELGVPLDHVFQDHLVCLTLVPELVGELALLLGLGKDRLQVHHRGVATLHEFAVEVEHIGDAAGHSGGEVASGDAQDGDGPAGHVFAAVISDAFDDGGGARVAYGETLAGHAAEVRLTRDRPIKDDVPRDDVFGRLATELGRWRNDDAAAREPLPAIIVGIADQFEGHTSSEERPEALARGPGKPRVDGAIGQPLVPVAPRDLVREHRTDGTVAVPDRHVDRNLLAALERRSRKLDQPVVEGLLESVILFLRVVACDVRGHVRHLENPREVEAFRLPVPDALLHVEQVGAADQLAEPAYAELGHQLSYLLGDEEEVVHNVLRLARKLLAEHGILGRNAHRASVQVALAHQDATAHDERRGREPEFVGAEDRADHHVAAGLDLSVHLDRDPAAQAIEHQRLLRLRQAQLPGRARVLDRRPGRGARAAVVPGNGDVVGLGFGHACSHGADAHFRDELHRDGRGGIRVLQVVDQLGQVFDRVDVMVRGRRNQLHSGSRVADLGDVIGDLAPGQLPALAGLGSLRDLDLELLGACEIFGGHPETPRGDLLDLGLEHVAFA